MFGIDSEMVQMALQNEIVLGMLMLSVLGTLMYLIRGIFSGIFNIAKRQLTVNTTVSNQDNVTFTNLTRWLSEVPGLTSRLRTFRVGMIHDDDAEAEYYVYPGVGKHFFFYNRHPYMVHLELQTEKNQIKEIFTISTLGRSNEHLAEIINSFSRIDHENVVKIFSFNYGWSIASKRKLRAWDSVFYNDRKNEDMLNDIRTFISSEDWYTKHGIPYHRGYLLEGDPGTGKTSLIHALASELDYDVFMVDLNALHDADDLLDAIRTAPKKGLVVIEDIDSFSVSRDRKEQDKKEESIIPSKFNLSSLLNSLDGLCSVEGRIIVMTTNHPEKLDPALIRPGRVDKRVAIGLPNQYTIERMYRHFIPTGEGVDAFVRKHHGSSTSEIQGALFDICTK